jgi:Bacteriophage minor capsid protein
VEGSTGWSCTVGYLADDQDQAVALFPDGGAPTTTLSGSNIRPHFQVRVRNAKFDYAAGEAKIRAIYQELETGSRHTGSGSPNPLLGFALIHSMSGAGPHHWVDERERNNWTMNFHTVRDA